jgi:hypothetical protein
MSGFNPEPDEKITIGRDTYRVSPHPSVSAFAFGQEGRKAFVFQLAHTKRRKFYALKKFKEAFRFSDLSDICLALAQYAHLPGMGVCHRECLVGPDFKNVLKEYPDLEYAVLMPWMNGSTWYDFVVNETPLDLDSSLAMAWKTSEVLAKLEEAELAHCDIAGANVIIDMEAGEVHLVDVEDMYAPGMPQPQAVPAGTDGYNHLTAGAGLWYAEADRFAGAVLLAEMLGWHNSVVRDLADDEHYFALGTMQQDSDAYRLLLGTLYDTSPALSDLFERAWFSPTLEDCPPLAEWARVLDPLARPSPVTEWMPLTAVPVPAAPHPGNWEQPPAEEPPVDVLPSIALPVEVTEDETPQPEPEPSPAPPPQPIAPPPVPDGDGPLIGFRPLDLSSLASEPAPAETDERTSIEPPPPETVAEDVPARPIEMLPSESTLDDLSTQPIEAPVSEHEAPSEETQTHPVVPPPQAPAVEPEDVPFVETSADTLADEDTLPMPVKVKMPPTRPRLRLPRLLKRQVEEKVPPTGDPPLLPSPTGDSTPELEEPADASPLLIAPPDPPRLRLADPDGEGSHLLFWEVVPEAVSYVLQESTRMGFSDGKQVTVRDATEWPVNNRPPGTYYYRVRAHTEDDFSAWSNIVFVKIEAE